MSTLPFRISLQLSGLAVYLMTSEHTCERHVVQTWQLSRVLRCSLNFSCFSRSVDQAASFSENYGRRKSGIFRDLQINSVDTTGHTHRCAIVITILNIHLTIFTFTNAIPGLTVSRVNIVRHLNRPTKKQQIST